MVRYSRKVVSGPYGRQDPNCDEKRIHTALLRGTNGSNNTNLDKNGTNEMNGINLNTNGTNGRKYRSLSSYSNMWFFENQKIALKQIPKNRQFRLKLTKMGKESRYFVLEQNQFVIKNQNLVESLF